MISSKTESFVYFIVSVIAGIVGRLPIRMAIALGRSLGMIAYGFDIRHRTTVYLNLKIAFARSKSPDAIKRLVREVFAGYGANFIEILRMSVLVKGDFEKYVRVEGREHIEEALKKQKGVIILAMHSGSWEVASFIGKILNHPYCVIANPQKKYTGLNAMINAYREEASMKVILRGRGTREVIENLRKNHIVALVVDQGGKMGQLIRLFGRQASLSVGAIKLGLKYDVPICFCIIHREDGPYHRLIVNPPLSLIKTEDTDKNVISNLDQVARMMEHFISEHPAEYMWFYKVWKYSKERTVLVLNDGKMGHLRQSQAVAGLLMEALAGQGIRGRIQTADIQFKNKQASRWLSVLSFLTNPKLAYGRLTLLKWSLSPQSFSSAFSLKADYIISCGSSIAPVNFLLSRDNRAKSLCILKPGILGYRRFDKVFLPQHDLKRGAKPSQHVVALDGAPNLMNKDYLEEQAKLLTARFANLKDRRRNSIGLLLGGETKKYTLHKNQIKIVMNQIKEAVHNINSDILITTSRRTPGAVEDALRADVKGSDAVKLYINAHQNNIPEAVGGILGLSDIVIVSGDSISMISEAASSGKNVIVFPAQRIKKNSPKDKHDFFIEKMHADGHIVLVDEKSICRMICDMAKNKIRTKVMDHNRAILEALREVV